MSGSTAKAITWAYKGSKTDLGAVAAKVGRGVKVSAKLAGKVEKGEIIGDPHITRRKDGSTDPLHVSGLLGKGNLKRSNRATSFHYYIESGELVFSDKNIPALRIGDDEVGTAADAIPAHQKASDWVWDEHHRRHRYFDGRQWVWQEGEGSVAKKQ